MSEAGTPPPQNLDKPHRLVASTNKIKQKPSIPPIYETIICVPLVLDVILKIPASHFPLIQNIMDMFSMYQVLHEITPFNVVIHQVIHYAVHLLSSGIDF